MARTRANPRAGDAGARQEFQSGRIGSAVKALAACCSGCGSFSECSENGLCKVNAAAPIGAELSGSNTCSAAGLTVTGHAPVLAMCRQLLAAGLDPDTAMEVYRGATLALTVRSIGEGARLAVRDDRHGCPRFVAYRPGPAERGGEVCGNAPPIAPNGTPLCPVREAAR
jgi:hypothetical protein